MAVAGGSYHSLGLKGDGSIVAWGYNEHGQCNVPAANSGFVAVAGGFTQSVALRVRVPGDLNCDAVVNFKDINPFVAYLSSLSSWQNTFPGCPPWNGDINSDGTYPSFGDINPFVALLSGGGSPGPG